MTTTRHQRRPIAVVLWGGVDLTTTSPRRVRNTTIIGGATAGGVGVRATQAAVTAAFCE